MKQGTSTASTACAALRELEELDFAEGLSDKNLRITVDGISWSESVPLQSQPKQRLLDFYYFMALTRAVDNEIIKLSRKGLALGKHLPCAGHEAIAVGAALALSKTDWITAAIRDLGAFLVRGITPFQILAQACGRRAGLTGGWDGSLHMGNREARIAGLVSHLGTLLAVATGCAFAEKYRDSDHVALSFLGEGSSSTGDFHESMNIASVLQLPFVLVIENNQWAFGTPHRLQYAVPTLALRALAYGKAVEGYWIDGTDVTTVYHTVAMAAERARRDGTISIIEAVTMRFLGHSLADPFMTYVPSRQLAKWKKKDPVPKFRELLLHSDFVDSTELDEIDSRIGEEVVKAAIAAEQSDEPDADNIESRVFASSVHESAFTEPPSYGRRLTYRQAIHDALEEEMDRDPTLFMVGEDVGISNGAFKITEGFSQRYDRLDWQDYWDDKRPFRQRRVVDAPIAEAGFTGLALGAVLNGLRAVVEYQYADFASEAFKMIVNYAATETVRGMGPVPIVFRLPSGWAPNTSIYHSVNPESWFASTPGLKIVAPITAFDAKGLLKAAIRDNNPVLFLEYKCYYRFAPEKLPSELNLAIPEEDYVVPLGSARVVRTGTDISVITYGSQIMRAVEAAGRLEQEGVSVEVIDLRSLIPLDAACIQSSVRKTNRVVVTCEAPRTGCFGNTIVTEIIRTSFNFLDAPVRLVAAADTPVPFSPVLEAAHLPTTEKLITAIRETLVC